MKIVIVGGAGFIGRALVDRLLERNHDLTVIDKTITLRQAGVTYHRADVVNERLHSDWFDGVDAVVHLAGAPLFGRRWTPSYRDELYASRIMSAKRVVQAVSHLEVNRQPKIMVGASAIGYYGDRGDEVLTEHSAPGDDFLAALCQDWEEVWQPARKAGKRVVVVRTGIVLHESGGIVAKLKPFISLGLGVVFGNGKQWLSWIGLHDLITIYVTAIENSHMEGLVNAVAPKPLHERDFMKRLSAYYRRPLFLDIPRWLVVLVIGEASVALLSSQRVKPAVLLDGHFAYRSTTIRSALDS